MAKPIGINFQAENEEVIKASEEVQDGLTDIERALEDVGNTSQTTETKQTDALTKVEDSAKNLGRTVTDDTAGAFDNLADAAESALGGIGDDLLSVAGIAGGVGGLVATAVQGGISLVQQSIQEQQDAARQLQEGLVNAYKAASDESRNYLSQAQITAAAQDILFDTAPGGKMDQYREKAAAIGVDVQTYVLAQAGSYKDLQVVIEAAREAEEKRQSIPTTNRIEAVEEGNALRQIITENEKLAQLHEDNKAAAEASTALRVELDQRERDSIARTAEASQARYDALAEQHRKASELEPIVIPASIATPDVDSLLDSIQRQAKSKTINFQVSFQTRDGQQVYP